MSSSRRNMRSRRSVGPCPSCGSRRMVAVTEEVTLHLAGQAHPFPAVAHEKCQACGERVFSLAVSQMFDRDLIPRRGRKRAA